MRASHVFRFPIDPSPLLLEAGTGMERGQSEPDLSGRTHNARGFRV